MTMKRTQNLLPPESKPDPQADQSSGAYFVLHRDAVGYSELHADTKGKLSIRRTERGVVTATIPLGSATELNIEQLQGRLGHILSIFDLDHERRWNCAA